MGFQYLFVYKMQKSKNKTDLYCYYKHTQSDMKEYQFDMKEICCMLYALTGMY